MTKKKLPLLTPFYSRALSHALPFHTLTMTDLPEPAVIAGAVHNQQNILAAIHNLGQQMNQRFKQMNQRFEQMNQRFEQTNQRFEQMNQRFGQVNLRFEQMNQRFDRIDNRQTNFEIAAVNGRLFHADGAAILQRPVNIHNGGDIPNFPPSLPQLYEIDGTSFILLECRANSY